MSDQVAPDEVAVVVGGNIRARRLQLGLTQQGLADRIGTYPSHVSAIESGSKTISLPSLAAWADALETTASQLLREPKKSA
jgi:transcriptional regulator with XRE-family HTH domain